MKDERNYPCWGCEYFQGYRPIETLYDEAFNPPQIHVEIPICGRIIYCFALNRCDYYTPDEFMIEYKQWKIQKELIELSFGC